MRGLIITVGISNSGKSTWASKIVQRFPNKFIRVNRDDIRRLLYGYTDENVSEYYGRKDLNKLEKQVSRYEDTLIYDGLEHDKIVIVDATHLKRAYLERFKFWNVKTWVKSFDIELSEADTRDRARSRKVGFDVLKKQYAQYKNFVKELEKNPIDWTPVELKNDPDKPYAIVFDIDGTLSEKGDRSAYDWHKVTEDTEIEGVCMINRFLAKGFKQVADKHGDHLAPKLLIATGRDGVCLPESEQWLSESELEYDGIYIRPKGDMRPDWIVKREMAEEMVKKYHIVGWFDDRLQVSRHLRMLGLNVYNVAHGNF